MLPTPAAGKSPRAAPGVLSHILPLLQLHWAQWEPRAQGNICLSKQVHTSAWLGAETP